MPRKYAGPLQPGRKSAYVKGSHYRNRNRPMTKTTKKGAYARNKKRNMLNRRNPFVENKTRTAEDLVLKVPSQAAEFNTLNSHVLPYSGAYTLIPVPVLTYMTNGTAEDDMIGQSIYARYLNMKFEFEFPKNEHIVIVPANLYLVHGWIKSSPNMTGKTTPTAPNFQWSGGSDDNDSQVNWIQAQVASYFDERADSLRFLPKNGSNLQILGYKKIVPNMQHQFSQPPQPPAVGATTHNIGGPPLKRHSISWTINRKIHYDKGKSMDSGDDDFYYINTNQWVPFVALFNPQFADYGQTESQNRIRVRSNQILYYQDS